ncbi:CBS domain-containing protein [Spongiimicrobium sp. 3-5]|uniref:CBS domain-containing protein n=1 Tax=Spongiimicrobium sp. 3-5 TaxID=3332596 RepID=UPI00397FAA51
MGELKVKKLKDSLDKGIYIQQLLTDIDALEYMLNNDLLEQSPIRIGAEQEFCLVDRFWEPSNKAQEILKTLKDPHFTSELTLYNLEVNLDPLILEDRCFSDMHKELKFFLNKASTTAEVHGSKVLLTGILPTIETKHLEGEYMTPVARYRILNEAIREIRKDNIELHIKGVDELNLHHDSILYEGCNTSFQCHLQIDPKDFRAAYNWSQAIAGPILSVCCNSPLLLGRELWEETRISLFTQSVDTRASTFFLNERESRVNFGNEWARGSVVDFYKDSVVGFRSIIGADYDRDSFADLANGNIPKLKALGLHNGTVYKWNRPCYGVSEGEPHIRIENRYIPAGPSTSDEIANMMFWVGVMLGRPKTYDNIHDKVDFKDVKGNFFNAARYGMASQFYWDGKLISCQELLLDHFLPMAYKGLYSMKVSAKDVENYLSIIENRIKNGNGARWTINGYRKLRRTHKPRKALNILTAAMYKNQIKGYPVNSWELPRNDEEIVKKEQQKVGHIMQTKTITAQENDSLALVLRMMQWKEIHHVPVLNNDLNLTGLLTWTDLENHLQDPADLNTKVSDTMRKKLIVTGPDTSLAEAKGVMSTNKINCLPVVKEKKLLGIITMNDF